MEKGMIVKFSEKGKSVLIGIFSILVILKEFTVLVGQDVLGAIYFWAVCCLWTSQL